jgi:NAD(P)-dependent dehydrogenase (short-subunit alcohol dehydrogenase family)
MDLKLTGKRALISGSTKGIGLAIATALAREGARVVNQISGGKPFAEFEKEFFKTVRPSSLLKRFITTEEVASLVAYVCSPLASATNGAALRVDGGVVQACF